MLSYDKNSMIVIRSLKDLTWDGRIDSDVISGKTK